MKKNFLLNKLVYMVFVFIFVFLIFPIFAVKISNIFKGEKISKNFITSVNAINENEFRGIWFSLLEWQKYNNFKNEKEWEKIIDDEIIKNLKILKINNIFVHAISHSDSFYPSDLYPTSKIISKGEGKNLDFDFYKILVNRLKENIHIK